MGKKAKLIKNAQATKNVYDKILKEEIESLKNCPNLFDMKFTDYNWNVLHLAIWNNKKNVIQYVLSDNKGKTLVNEKDINEEFPLHLAAFLKDIELYKQIKAIENYEKSKNKCGETPEDFINKYIKLNHSTTDGFNDDISSIPMELTATDIERMIEIPCFNPHGEIFAWRFQSEKYQHK